MTPRVVIASCVMVAVVGLADYASAQVCPCDFAGAESRLRGARAACSGVWSNYVSGDADGWDGVAFLDFYKIRTVKSKGQTLGELPGELMLEMWLSDTSSGPTCNIVFFRKSGAVSSQVSQPMSNAATISACIGALEALVPTQPWPLYDSYINPTIEIAGNSCRAEETANMTYPNATPGELQDFFPEGDEAELLNSVSSLTAISSRVKP